MLLEGRCPQFPRQRGAASALCLAALVCCPGCPPPEGVSPRGRAGIAIIRDERPGLVRLEGIGPIAGFARGRDNTFAHCLELVLNASGQRVSYDEVMGLSGLAFRVQFRVDRWDVGNPDPLVGENCLPPLFAAIGWDCDLWVVRRDELAEADAMRRGIRRSIDNGVPVLAANVIPPEDWGIITGYQRDGAWLCRAYNGGAEQNDRRATGWPTAVVLLTQRKPLPSPQQSHRDSIRRAVELFDKRVSGSYAVGSRAFDEWCQSLRSVRDEKYVHANFWTYVGLIDARGAAVRYLRQIAKEIGGSEARINMAADWYDKEVRLLLEGLRNVPSERAIQGVMPPAEVRIRQIDVLRQAQTYEASAIETLRKAM